MLSDFSQKFVILQMMIQTKLTHTLLRTTPARIKLLADKLEIRTIEDFLEYLPRDYEDLSQISPLKEFRTDQIRVAEGTLGPISSRRLRGKMTLQKALFTDKTGDSLECLWFGQAHLKDMFAVGDKVLLAGKIKFDKGKRILNSPVLERQNKSESVHLGKIVPIYPATEGLSAKWLREKIILLKNYFKEIPDFLPEEIILGQKLMRRNEALKQIHFPESHAKLQEAKARIAFEEAFGFQLAALLRRREYRSLHDSPQIPLDANVIKKFIEMQPFTPTNAQKIALYEILRDLEKSVAMVRLLQGDVGSGKTFVAVASAVNVIFAGYQVAFLAPTEILARQHFQKIFAQLEKEKIKVRLLLGSTSAKEKKEIKAGLASREVQFVVGTHALLTEDVSFAKLGLAIVDEQHRFGVEQREKLRQHGTPHFLALSATPIPRSLALALFGDTDVSVISEMPHGREPILTKVVSDKNQIKALYFIEDEVAKGRQAFFVYPLVNDSESEKLANVKSATEAYKSIKDFYKKYKVGLIHGQMKSEEKKKIMQEFAENKIQILVSTSVIEVGVDVPNATVMVIEGAERFGLAQLHQFRGRVGRGGGKSYCFLFTSRGVDYKNARLDALEKTTDGFKLSEIDLSLRGPGAIFGTLQSGFPDFRMANLLDGRLISRCRQVAEDFLSANPTLVHFPLLEQKLKNLKLKRA